MVGSMENQIEYRTMSILRAVAGKNPRSTDSGAAAVREGGSQNIARPSDRAAAVSVRVKGAARGAQQPLTVNQSQANHD